MIRVTRFNGTYFYVNAEMVKIVEGTPDTVISLTDGSKIVVRETPESVVEEIIVYRRRTNVPFAPEKA